MLGEKFAEQIEQLRFGVLKSMPIRESSQVIIKLFINNFGLLY